MRTIFLIIVLWVGAWGPAISANQDKEPDKQEDQAAQAKKEGEHARTLQMPLIIVPVITRSGVKRYYGIHMRLQLKDKNLSLEAQGKLPRLADAIFTTLYKLFAINDIANTQMTPIQVRDRIVKICTGLLGKETVRHVIIDSFTMHNFIQKPA